MKLASHYQPSHSEWVKFFQQLNKFKSPNLPVSFSGENGVGKNFCSQLLLSTLNITAEQVETVSVNDPLPISWERRGRSTRAIRFIQKEDISVGRQEEIIRFLESSNTGIQMIWIGYQSLTDQFQNGKLCDELFYALNIFDYKLPSLSEIPDDVEGFGNYFLSQICYATSLPLLRLKLSEVDILKRQAWIANLDTLHYVLRRSMAQSSGPNFDLDLSISLAPQVGKYAKPISTEHDDFISGVPVDRLEKSVNEFKKKLVIETLKKAGGNKSNAAKLLGVSKAYIFRLIQVLDIDLD
jgi:DNA-binding NtrC family response regulator